MYKFPFQFFLPAHLPSSFEGELGFIRYTVTVLIDIPFEAIKEISQKITILKMIDLNDNELQVFMIKFIKFFVVYLEFNCFFFFAEKSVGNRWIQSVFHSFLLSMVSGENRCSCRIGNILTRNYDRFGRQCHQQKLSKSTPFYDTINQGEIFPLAQNSFFF